MLSTLLMASPSPQSPPSPAADPNQQPTCISPTLARNCLRALEMREYFEQRSSLQAEAMQSQGTEMNLLKAQGRADALALRDWQARLQHSEALADQQRRALDAWYHDPFIVGILGIAVGVAATSTVVVVVSTHH